MSSGTEVAQFEALADRCFSDTAGVREGGRAEVARIPDSLNVYHACMSVLTQSRKPNALVSRKQNKNRPPPPQPPNGHKQQQQQQQQHGR